MGCWDIYCCICGNSCVSLHEENMVLEEFRKVISIKECADLVKKSKWIKKATMLLQNNKIVHGCERVGDNVEFEDKNGKKYEAIWDSLNPFDSNYEFDTIGIFIHTNCWKYVKIKYKKELKYSDIPLEFKNKKITPQIDYGSITKYQQQEMDYYKMYNDKNMYMLSDPLKTDKMNNIRLKKIINQFKLKTELRPSPSMSATFNKTGDIRIGNNGKFWIIKNNKWVEIKDKIIKKSVIININNKSVLQKMQKSNILQLGEKNTIEIQFIGNVENVNKISNYN